MTESGTISDLPIDGARQREAFDRTYERVYAELSRYAHEMRRRVPATAETGSLVHEAYLKLVGSKIQWEDRSHFFAVAAKAMRHILVDRARKELAKKRGGGEKPLSINDVEIAEVGPAEEILAINAARQQLKKVNPRLARVVEYRYFLGLDENEIAELLGISLRTVRRDWLKAKLFLDHELRCTEAKTE